MTPNARGLAVGFGPGGVAMMIGGAAFSLFGCATLFAMSAATGPNVLLPVVFPVVGFLLLFIPIRGYLRTRRAFIHGTPLLAEVVSFGQNRKVRFNGVHPTELVWMFEVGPYSFRGSVSTINPTLLGERVPGAPVVILHDPANPSVSTLWVE